MPPKLEQNLHEGNRLCVGSCEGLGQVITLPHQVGGDATNRQFGGEGFIAARMAKGVGVDEYCQSFGAALGHVARSRDPKVPVR